VTHFPPHERIRRGLRRTYQISALFPGLSVLDNVYLACCGVSRGRFSLLRPRRNDAQVQAAENLVQAVHLTAVKDQLVAELSHGQQRQLEIALALAGAPRVILFDEPAAGLSPTERAELVEILTSLPSHIGYIIIEHDMDAALRVVESVTMMHNGRIFKEGARRRSNPIRKCRSFIWEAAMADASALLTVRGLNVYYGHSHALQGVEFTIHKGVLAIVGRNGMGKTTLCKTIMGLVRASSGTIRFGQSDELTRLNPAQIARLGIGYVPQGRRLWRSLTVDEPARDPRRP
jgi:ABC-type branched-subunit amino acid transport system ATPase component